MIAALEEFHSLFDRAYVDVKMENFLVDSTCVPPRLILIDFQESTYTPSFMSR